MLNRYSFAGNNPINYTDRDGHSFWRKIGNFFKKFGGTILSVAFTFVGMSFIGAVVSSAFSTFVNGGSFADFGIGFGVGIVAGYVGGTLAGKLVRFTNMNLAGIETALLRGGLSGTIAGAGTAAIYNQDIGKGAWMGAASGMAVGGIVWAKNDYVTNKFLKNNVKWDSSVSDADRATFTQAIKEAGQSPLGQREFGKIMADNRIITFHSMSEAGGYVPYASPNDIYLNPDIDVTRTYNAPHYNQLKTIDMGTLILHEMGHASSYPWTGEGGGPMMHDPLNVSYHENPYRAWIGTPARTGYYGEGDVEFRQCFFNINRREC
jgi:hypothetical protein